MRILLAAIMTRFRLLCSSEHVIGHQEISFLASVMLMHCFSVNAQLLEHSSTSLLPRTRKKIKIDFCFFALLRPAQKSVHNACSGRVTPLL
jgi:cell division protein ZapA (FtsZ GTPase activity inhibitor)